MNIDYDDVEIQFKVSVEFNTKVTKTVHKHANLSDVEESIIDDIYKKPHSYMDDLEVTGIERII